MTIRIYTKPLFNTDTVLQHPNGLDYMLYAADNFGGTLYLGGWLTAADIGPDQLYQCSNPLIDAPKPLVWTNAQSPYLEYHLNDPSVVVDPANPDILFMYMTALQNNYTSFVDITSRNEVGLATSNDGGLTWTWNGVVIGFNNGADDTGAWSPSALDINGRVNLWYHTGATDLNTGNWTTLHDYRTIMNAAGTAPQTTQECVLAGTNQALTAVNVDVKQASDGTYWLIGQDWYNQNHIVAYESTDGLSWTPWNDSDGILIAASTTVLTPTIVSIGNNGLTFEYSEVTPGGTVVHLCQQGPGPTANNGAVAVGRSGTVSLTSLIAGLVTPGVTGDSETLTSVIAAYGKAVLGSGNAVTYTAPASGSDIIRYTVNDQHGGTATGQLAVAVDAGPTANNGLVAAGHSGTVCLTSLIAGLITPVIAGDTETLTSVTATRGKAVLGSGNAVTYTAPASGSDTISYTVKDQYGDTATGKVTVAVDAGPTANTGAVFAGHGATVSLTSLIAGLITPGIAGDTKTLTSVTATRGKAVLGSGNAVTYTVPASGSDTISYTVKDQYGDTATGTVAVTVDPGPTPGNAHLYVAPGQRVDLTSILLALDAPGLPGDTLALTTAGASGVLTKGDLSYTAPATGGTYVFTYTVSDQNKDVAVGSVAVTAAANLNTGTTIDLTGSGNIVVGGNGNDVITGGTGANWISLGGGKDKVVLGSSGETVNGGGGTTLVQATTATAGALINGGAGKTTLEVTNAGTATLNAATTNVTVILDAAANLTLSKMAFVTAIGSAGSDTITALAANQTLTGGAGTDTLVGYGGFGDTFSDTSAGLNGDMIKLFGGSDLIDLTDLSFTKAKALAYAGTTTSGVLTATDSTHSATITFAGAYTLANFKMASDANGGALISFHA